MRILRTFDAILEKIEFVFITLLLSLMILLSLGQVILRNFFHEGILWADIFLRQMVLWVGFLGASLATRDHRHIAIEFLPNLLPRRWKKSIRLVVHLVAGGISLMLVFAAWKLVALEKDAGTILFLDFPVWWFQTILPYSFLIIALRFFINALNLFFPPGPTDP